MGSLTSRLTVSLKDDVSGPAKGAASSLKAVGASAKDLERLGKIDAFRGMQKSFAQARSDFNATQAAVKRVAQEMASADAPSRKLEAGYKAAQRAAKSSADAFQQQASAIKAGAAALRGAGIPIARLVSEENRLRAVIERTTAAAAKRNGAVSLQEKPGVKAFGKIAGATGAVVGAGAAVAGYKAKEFGKKAVVSAAEFDIGVRKQRAFVDVPQDVQDEVLVPQAKKIGQDTQFTNLDVVKAQTGAMQGLPSGFDAKLRAEVGAGIVESVKNYALVMEADLERSSEAIRTFLQTTNKDISTKEKAIAEATRSTNLMVKMAKLGGMNDEDVQQFMKFGAATGTAAGLSDTSLAALGSVGRRGGLRGDELGVFVRAIASKLVSPTSKGLDALTTAGIDYNKFTKMPGGLSVDNLEGLQKRRFGKSLNEDQRSRLSDVLEDGEVVSNRDEFTKQVSEILAESFEKKKNGETKAQDAQKIAKMVGDFHKLSAESVDTEGLLNAIMTNPKMTIPLLNGMFTDKHGGKGSILASKWPQFQDDKKELDKVSQDPEFAKRKADEIMGGLGGEFERAKGSVENFTLALGQAFEAITKLALQKGSAALDAASNAPASMQRWGAGLTVGAGALGGSMVTRAVLERLGVIGAGTGGGAVAGGLVLGAGAGAAMSDISTDVLNGGLRGVQKEQIVNLYENSMLGAMSGDAGLAAAILNAPEIKLPEREKPVQPKTPIADARRRSWNADRLRQGVPELPDPKTAWVPDAAPPKADLDQSVAADSAGTKTGEAFKTKLDAELETVDAAIKAAVARWSGMLSGVTGPGFDGASDERPALPAAPPPWPSEENAAPDIEPAREDRPAIQPVLAASQVTNLPVREPAAAATPAPTQAKAAAPKPLSSLQPEQPTPAHVERGRDQPQPTVQAAPLPPSMPAAAHPEPSRSPPHAAPAPPKPVEADVSPIAPAPAATAAAPAPPKRAVTAQPVVIKNEVIETHEAPADRSATKPAIDKTKAAPPVASAEPVAPAQTPAPPPAALSAEPATAPAPAAPAPAATGGNDIWDSGADAVKHLDRSAEAQAAGQKTGQAFADAMRTSLSSLTELYDAGESLDQSGQAGSAGAKTGSSFRSAMAAELRGVDAEIQQAMARWAGMLGSFSASPTITPKISTPSGGGGAASGGKQAATIDSVSARQQAAFADYGFNTV